MKLFWEILGKIVTILGIPGLVFAVYSHLKNRKRCHLTYYQTSSTLITKLNDDFYEDIEIKFQGHQIDKLTSTIFRVWNSGNIAIKQSDIAPKAPLQIQANSKILTTRITKQPHANCGIAIENEKIDNLIRFNFDFLNPEDGVVCEVIHAGENTDLILSGEIIGETKKLQKVENINNKKPSEYYIGIITLITAFSAALVQLLQLNWKKTADTLTDPALVLINLLFAVIIFVSCFIIFYGLYQIRKRKIPISLID